MHLGMHLKQTNFAFGRVHLSLSHALPLASKTGNAVLMLSPLGGNQQEPVNSAENLGSVVITAFCYLLGQLGLCVFKLGSGSWDFHEITEHPFFIGLQLLLF